MNEQAVRDLRLFGFVLIVLKVSGHSILNWWWTLSPLALLVLAGIIAERPRA